MKRASLVTLGVTCYNASKTISRALRSATLQDWPACEIVVVDDASTDGSLAIVKKFNCAKVICHSVNLGVGAARNTILKSAQGEFVAFFDDDDESYPSRVREQIQVLEQCEKATGSHLVACYAGGTRLYANGYKVGAPAIGAYPPVPFGPAVADHLLTFKPRSDWFFGSGVPASALLARRSLIQEMNGFDQNLRRLEDVDFAVRLALRGGFFTGPPTELYIRHMTDGGDKIPEANLSAEIAIAEKHRTYLQSINRYEYAKRWPKLRYWHFKGQYIEFLLELACLMMQHPVATVRHLVATGPKRLIHEHRMRRRGFA